MLTAAASAPVELLLLGLGGLGAVVALGTVVVAYGARRQPTDPDPAGEEVGSR